MTWGAVVVAALLVAGIVSPASVDAAPQFSTYDSSSALTQVDVSGANGGALIWPLWTVVNTNTLIAITNTSVRVSGTDEVAGACGGNNCPSQPSITPTSPGLFTLVRFHFRRATDSADQKDFSICLSPGDVWTAALTKVGGVTKILSSDLSTINNETGSGFSGLNESLPGNPDIGYIEAVAVDTGTTKDTGCAGPPGGFSGSALGTARAMVRHLMGEVFYVSLGTGLANGANATSIGAFQAIEAQSSQAVVDTIRSAVFPTGDSGAVNNARNRVFFALTHPGEHVTVGSLVTRWILDETAGFDTQLVVTFPLGNLTMRPFREFGFNGSDNHSDRVDFNFNIPTTMALWLRDDEEHRSNSPRQVPMGKEVNVITLSTEAAANPTIIPSGAKGGWLQLMIDNDENEFVDAVRGANCSVSASGDVCTTTGTLNQQHVPAMLPVVGFSILTSTTSGGKLSALLPWKWRAPDVDYDCNETSIDRQGRCRGNNVRPHFN